MDSNSTSVVDVAEMYALSNSQPLRIADAVFLRYNNPLGGLGQGVREPLNDSTTSRSIQYLARLSLSGLYQ
jgi:hypothetical protein